MQVPFVDLKAQYRALEGEIVPAVTAVMERGDFIMGRALEEFESAFAELIGTRYCFGVASGTDALHLALCAAGIGAGDEVLVPANTYIATALAVSEAGARPVLVDVRPDTFNMDPEQLDGALSERTRAVLPVHLYGQPADMAAIGAFAERHGLQIIEDACQAHAAVRDGTRCGAFGRLGTFSFYPGKNLGAYGDGGAITTDDAEAAERIPMLRNYGQKVKYEHLMRGGNSRLDTLQAAILNVKLKHLEDWSRARFAHAVRYTELLGDVDEVGLPAFDASAPLSHVFHLFVIRVPQRDALLAFLKERDVSCGIHYPIPIHLQPAYADLGYAPGAFPVTEQAAGEILSLPMFAELTDAQIAYAAESIKAFFAKG
ncbi:MAG: DegT/DnrJ/EryC1/StrS family aminotransferase [Lentisphaerae bacterium]|nr:DegT/DnrJ/EryC1/StrS family aminotransferase [Lentisphaerota bacterium]